MQPAVEHKTPLIIQLGHPQPVRATIVSPNTSTSIRVRKKHSKASTGLHTTGSFSLNEVFSTIGTPVRSTKASISR